MINSGGSRAAARFLPPSGSFVVEGGEGVLTAVELPEEVADEVGDHTFLLLWCNRHKGIVLDK